MNFYFFDLETSGFRARDDRIMQFAGQRTDMDLHPIGEPDNILIKLTDDVLPQPDAILVTGITPQATRAGGITEAEFLKYFAENIATDNTIMVGFNNLRFDNEFIRFTLWRNFYDAYEWSWKNGCSTWDMLDVVRMTRALRPDGIKWPFAPDGKPSNRLEFLSSVNKLEHANAHDALSDVNATIDVARLIKQKQPKLFDYLLKHRGKKMVEPLVTSGQPLVYTSGRYPSDWEKTTVAVMIAAHPDKSAALMYDLRIDPEEFADLPPAELAERWTARGEDVPYFPVKILSYNKCPAIAPLSVLDDKSTQRLKLRKEIIENHLGKLKKLEDFGDKLVEAVKIMGQKYEQQSLEVEAEAKDRMAANLRVDAALYDGFINDADKNKMRVVRAADAEGLADLDLDFADDRLKHLLPLYKARNYPKSLNEDEVNWWEEFKSRRLMDGGEASRAAAYFKRLAEIDAQPGLSAEHKYLLEELQLYGESVLPEPLA
ncbi:MAG TPA: exodeoxyribonuclease I [Candidatus Saccharimonadales bacterium]|nr:exodeoxyribonuclease I [Candidatus Saccharimonadales bacterium]